MKKILLLLFLVLIIVGGVYFYISESSQKKTLSEAAKVGPSPTLPKPEDKLIPIVKIAKVIGWPKGVTPVAAVGLKVNAYASGLDHPRWIYTLPNGDVLVAESNAPSRSRKPKANLNIKAKVKDYAAGMLKKRAGAAVSSPNQIILLRDTNGDGIADQRTVFLDHLNSPFGMVLVGNDFYVANADSIMRFPYTPGETSIKAPGVKLVDLTCIPRGLPRFLIGKFENLGFHI